MMDTISPFSEPLYVMAKTAGAQCNLHCKYCYYLEKQKFYGSESKTFMSDGLLNRFIQDYIQSQSSPIVNFTWHGGEPLFRPLSFYQKAVNLQQFYSQGRQIDNCLQTNGTLLTDEWCEFFAQNHFLIGISIDGPKECHDAYRTAKGGAPTWDRVMHGIELLNKHGVDWNAMAVVNDINVMEPLSFYRFFRDELRTQYLQFTPIVEQNADGSITDFSVTADAWGNFLCTIFDEWVKRDVGLMFVQLFDATLANWCGVMPGVCTLAETCGHAGVMEWNGDLYSCDHFVFPQHYLGNIHQSSLFELMHSEKQRQFGLQKKTLLPKKCKQCDVLFACHGECPKNRLSYTEDGEAGLNYLCSGYRRFFHHVSPYMDFMRRELESGRAPANVMINL